MDSDSTKSRHNALQASMLGLAVMALLAGLGWWAAESRARVADVEMREQLLRQTSQIASRINLELARKLTFTPSDKGTPAYECLCEQLAGYGSTVPDARWLYCMTKRDDRIVFGVDIGFGGIEKTEQPAEPGAIYDDASAGLRQSFGEKQPFMDGPYADKWGTFVSAYAPVLDRQTGKTLMLVGLDIDADAWSARLNAARRGPIVITLIMMAVLAGTLILICWHNQRRTQDSLKLRAWIVVPTSLAASAGLVIFAAYAYRQNAEQSRRSMLRVTEQMRADCDRYVKSEIQLFKSQIDHIAHNPAMLKAWQDRDLATLNALAQPELEELKQKYNITQFYFIAPDRTCFLRVQQPTRRGDVIVRSTVLAAERTEEDVWGTELGPFGSFSLRYVRPWKQQGKVIGYVELGIEIKHLVDQLARDTDAEVVTVIRKDFTTRESFETGRQALGYVGQWDDYPDYAVTHQTSPQLSSDVMRWLTSYDISASGIKVFDAKQGEKQFVCGVVPLPNAVGRTMADLIVIRDVTAQSAVAQNDLLWIMSLVFVLLGGVVMLLWSVTSGAERQLSDAFATVRASQERFAQVAETTGEIIWEIDPQGLYTYVSHACETQLGYREKELVGKIHFYDLYPEAGRDDFRCRAFARIDQRKPFRDIEAPFVAKDGHILVTLLSGVPILNADGTLQGYRGSGKDITELKQAEDALERRIVALTHPLGDVGDITFDDLFNLNDIQRLQDEFAEATGVASIITRPDGTFITTPSNFCRLCEIIRNTDKGCANCRKSDAVVGRFHPEGPIVQPCTSGGLWDAGAAITVGGRHIASWLVGQVRDETQTEAKMVEYAREIGIDEQTFIEAFHEVPAMSRIRFEQVTKALFTLANQLSDTAYQNVQQARFITEHKRAEDALLHAKTELQQYVAALELSNHALQEVNELAEAATRAKSEFLTNMSHEIRTPMTAILGYADIMLEENVGRTTRQHVEVIKRNGKHLLEIINDILDLAKVEAGKMQIEPTRCSPVELLAEVVSLMRVRADAKHLKLVTEMTGRIPETILTDPLRLRQVLVNLVGNAIKFTDEGEVCINAQLTQDSGLPRLRINVIDTGIGMNEEEVRRLFHAFTQVDNSAKRKFGGSGMGLCISKRLAEALGGTIEVHSLPGKGSTFSLTIDPGPLDGIRMIQEGQDAAVRPAPIPPADPAKIDVYGRVLLAEDGPDNQRLVCMLLRKAGADVVAVENGQLAVETALAAYEVGEPFDVILMDMQMPVMDGYSATRRLREWSYTGPIIALTAHAMDHDCQKCLDAGCDDYATKPIDRQKLLAAVARWVGSGQARHDAVTTSQIRSGKDWRTT